MKNFFSNLTKDPRTAYTDKQQRSAKEQAGFGLGIAGAALMQDSSVASQAIGGAMTGFSMGGPLGALLGLGTSLIGGARRKADKSSYDRMMYDNLFANKSTEPAYYAKKGGIVMPMGDEEMIRTQAKKGEVAALPNGMIVNVHSDKKEHKDFKKGDKKTSDSFPAGTFIGDDTKLTKEAAEKIVLGAHPGVYKEQKEGNEPYKDIKLSDAIKKDKFTTAEGLKYIKDYVKVPMEIEQEINDPFSRITAQENLQTRSKFVGGLMELAAKKNKLLRKQLKSI